MTSYGKSGVVSFVNYIPNVHYKSLMALSYDEIKIGSHVGMAGKEMFLASVKEAERYGANVLMLYTGAPQNTRRKEIKDLNIEAGWEYATKAGIREIVVHAPYIINLANTVKPETFELAVGFLEKEIKRTAAMQSKILVLHPGSALDAGAEAGIAQAVKGLNMVLDANDDDVVIALETMAGKGSEIGRTFEELKMIYDGVHKKDRLRVCFDTCHVNDAGYDLVNDYDGVFQKFDEVLGLDQIAVFHINDSLNLLGAQQLGRGEEWRSLDQRAPTAGAQQQGRLGSQCQPQCAALPTDFSRRRPGPVEWSAHGI
jgi:deoxyribonuclease-4